MNPGARPWDAHPQVFAPTGGLHLALVEQTWDGHEWHDTKSSQVEQQLNATIIEMVRRAQYRRDQEQKRIRREAHRAVVERLRSRQEARIKQFQSAAAAYQKLRQVETFVDAVSREGEGNDLAKARRWLRWAQLITARDNPVQMLLSKLQGPSTDLPDHDHD